MDIDDIFKAALAVLELGVLEPRAQILGGVVIFDLEGFSLQQAWQVTPDVATKMLDLMGVSTSYSIAECIPPQCPQRTQAPHLIKSTIFFFVFVIIFITTLDADESAYKVPRFAPAYGNNFTIVVNRWALHNREHC